MSYYSRICWIDVKTTSLDPNVANIVDIAYIKEIDRKSHAICSYKVSPILHFEDMLYGKYDINEFCNFYNKNKKYHEKDPDRLYPFAFPQGDPLFFYSKSSLTHGVPSPQVLDPAEWLLGKDKVSAYQVFKGLIEDLTASVDEDNTKWILAGHNVKFDLDVLINCARRVLGSDKPLLNIINQNVYLDTVSLSRWHIYNNKIPCVSADLKTIAKALQITFSDILSAKEDVRICKEIAEKLWGTHGN